MRYRMKIKPAFMDLVWIFIALLQIVSIGDRLHRHTNSGHRFQITSDLLITVFWCLILLFYASKPFFSDWRLTADALTFYWLGRPGKKIIYSKIVAIRPQPGAKDPDSLEIETAQVSPEVYPHNYVIVAPKDRNGFLQALRSHLPPNVFESV